MPNEYETQVYVVMSGAGFDEPTFSVGPGFTQLKAPDGYLFFLLSQYEARKSKIIGLLEHRQVSSEQRSKLDC